MIVKFLLFSLFKKTWEPILTLKDHSGYEKLSIIRDVHACLLQDLLF